MTRVYVTRVGLQTCASVRVSLGESVVHGTRDPEVCYLALPCVCVCGVCVCVCVGARARAGIRAKRIQTMPGFRSGECEFIFEV